MYFIIVGNAYKYTLFARINNKKSYLSTFIKVFTDMNGMIPIKRMALPPHVLLVVFLGLLVANVFAVPSTVTYYEHLASYTFNTTTYLGAAQSNTFGFAAASESKAWNFTKDVAETQYGLRISAGTHTFNGSFAAAAAADQNRVYINWQLVEYNSSDGSEIEICRTPTGAGGQLITTTTPQNLSASCTLASNYLVKPGNYLRVNIYGYNTHPSQTRNIIHYWDTSAYSSNYRITQQVMTYTNDSTAFYCTSCSSCTEALSDSTYNLTYLNATISGAGATCIDNPNITGKTFDCNGHTISGTYVGYGIDMQGRHNASIIGCDIDAFNTGIRIADASSNITVDDCELVDNTADGVLVDSSDDIKILNSIGEDNSRGFRLRYSSNCYMDNDLAYWNNYGFEMYESDMNTINNSGAYDNDFYGVYLRVGSGNNSIWNTYSSDNWDSGFVIEDMTSTFNRIYDSNASGNTNDGFYANNNNWTWITNTRSTLNGRDGYRFDSSIWINLTNGTSYDNTGNGYSYNGGLGYLVAYSKAYDNGGYGLHAWGPTTINFLTFSDIYGNGLDGVFLEDGCNLHGLRNDSIYGNTGWGFHAKNSNYHIILDSFIYDNAGGGMLLDASDASNYTNLVLYNNSLANSYAISISNNSENNRFTDVLIYEETNYVYQEATAPSPNNFTNLTIGYGASVGLINWDFLSITDLYLNSTNVLLDPYFVSLDASTASEANASANVSIYAQSWYDVYKADGFPLTRDAIINGGYVYTPLAKSWANGILRFGVADFSGYAAKANCFYADTPDTIYNITDNLFGNKSNRQPLRKQVRFYLYYHKHKQRNDTM